MSYVDISIDSEDILEQLSLSEVIRYYDTEDIFMEMKPTQIVAGILECHPVILTDDILDRLFEKYNLSEYLSTMTASAIADQVQAAEGINMADVVYELQKRELQRLIEPEPDADDEECEDDYALTEKEFKEFEDYYFRGNIFSCGRVGARDDSHYKESLALWEACCKTKKEQE